jgi:hypothetical protein
MEVKGEKNRKTPGKKKAESQWLIADVKHRTPKVIDENFQPENRVYSHPKEEAKNTSQ